MDRYFIFIATAALLLFSGCSSGSDSETSTKELVRGVFYDSEVDGMDYFCASSGLSGVTGDLGIAGGYTCEEGDKVTFSIGEYELGTCDAEGVVTPSSLFPNNDEAALNVAQLLQTIDSDKDPSNGITIPEDATVLLATVPARPTDLNFDEAMEAVIGNILVQAEEAQDHLDETMAALEETLDCLPGEDCSDDEGKATDCLPGEDCSDDEGKATDCLPGQVC